MKKLHWKPSLLKFMILIIFIVFIFNSCTSYNIPMKYDANFNFEKDDIKIELYSINPIIHNNIAFFLTILRNNTDSIIYIKSIGSIKRDYNMLNNWCWDFSIADVNKNLYNLVVSTPEYLGDPFSDKYFYDSYRPCMPHDKIEMIFGIDFRELGFRLDKGAGYGKYFISLKYFDDMGLHENYVAGKAKSNTVAVEYLKEYNQGDFRLDSIK
jgi:hypothetical protein